jgi:predicted O-methyltransferase YrrM
MVSGDHVQGRVDFEIDGVRFVSGFADRGAGERLTLMKPAALVERYERLVNDFERPRMVELGIAYGGSLVWFALRAKPTKLVGVERKANRSAHLDGFIDSLGLAAIVRPHYGVDQADRDQLRAIVSAEFGDDPIDLVIDDASHRYAATLASFETLFPMMRPGGLYVIEDWTGLHKRAELYKRRLLQPTTERTERLKARIAERIQSGVGAETPLSRLVIEFMLVQTSGRSPIDELTVNEHWIAVRRGAASLSPTAFRLADHYTDAFGMVSP